MKTRMLAIAFLLVAHGTAKGDFTSGLINVDFNFTAQSFNQSGPALLGATGDVWNSELSVLPHTTGVLLLANGSSSNGVTYSLAGVDGGMVGGGPFLLTPYNALMSDGYAVQPGNTMNLTLNGLTASQLYDLYLYSVGIGVGDDGRTTRFTIGGNSRTAVNAGAASVFVEGNNYVHFPSQAADSAGHLTISIQGTGGAFCAGGLVNGFQIAAVPEPSGLLLFAVGLLGIAAVVATAHSQKPRRTSIG